MSDEETKTKGPKKYVVQVFRLGGDERNRKDPIYINTGKKETGGKIEFHPEVDVLLTETQIRILETAIEENKVEITTESGIYEMNNPKKEAEKLWPGYRIVENEVDGSLTAVREEKVYSVNYQGKRPF
jgi:hypothetical protein